MHTVLIVEDDPTMLRALRDNFQFKGYTVQTAMDGEDGLEKAVNGKPDLVILDVMLPKINGYEICRLVREAELDMPIIMLTAKGEESDVVLGLNLGADDYVTKPFSIRELMARSNAFLRRRDRKKERVISFGSCSIDLGSRKFQKNGRDVKLSPKEFGLLAFFLERPNRALTRDQILSAVWGQDRFVTQRSIDRFVNTLRNKIEDNPSRPEFIRTVREVGYRFELPTESTNRRRRKGD